MASYNHISIDVGSSRGLDGITDDILSLLSHIFVDPESRRVDFMNALRLTLPELPWPRKTNMDMIRPFRQMQILPSALSIDPLTGAFCQGFRIEIGADDSFDGFKLRRRALRYVELAPVQEMEPIQVEDLIRIVFSRLPGINDLEFVYTESEVKNRGYLADTEMISLCKKRYLVENVSFDKIWENEDGVIGEWLNVGMRENDSRDLQVVYDPGLFGIYVLTDNDIVKSEALPNAQKRKQLLSRIKEARAAKIPFEIFSASMKPIVDKEDDTDRIEFRKEKCACEATDIAVFEDKQTFSTAIVLSDAKLLGLKVTELEPVLASRTRYSDDFNGIDNDRFVTIMEKINPEEVVIDTKNLERIAFLMNRLVQNGETDYEENVEHVEGKLRFTKPHCIFKGNLKVRQESNHN